MWKHFGITVLTVEVVEYGFFVEATRFCASYDAAQQQQRSASPGSSGRRAG